MEAILVLPNQAYIQQQQTNENATRLKKLATELIHGTATEATAMELEGEHSTNIQHLQDLIRKESSKQDKTIEDLTKKCTHLENVVEFLMAKPATPLSKKKSTNCPKGNVPNTTQRTKSPKPRDKAPKSINATTRNSGAKRSCRRSSSKSQQKCSSSRSGRNKPRARSSSN